MKANRDIPSPIDFHDPRQVDAWIDETAWRRPWRAEFFAAFVAAIGRVHDSPVRVLELGSGPGHLAEQILSWCAVASYTLLDFSVYMHERARARLTPYVDRACFVLRDFRSPDWVRDLGPFEFVVTMQAVHETRNKRRAPALLQQARGLLAAGGALLYCDHYFDATSRTGNRHLYMTPDEQRRTLAASGFDRIALVLDRGGMALYSARASAARARHEGDTA